MILSGRIDSDSSYEFVKSRSNQTVSTLVGKGYSNYLLRWLKELPIQALQYQTIRSNILGNKRISKFPTPAIVIFGGPQVCPTFYSLEVAVRSTVLANSQIT
jgi:hypothetical protein